MKKNNEKLRTCIVCREKKDKSFLTRVVKNKDGDVSVDQTGKMNGRGCYICKSNDCAEKLKKVRALNKAFKTNISEEIYDKIRNEL